MPAEVVTMLDCQSNYGVFTVPSSRAGHFYTVTFNGSEGPAHCTCPSFKYSGADQHCKHITQVWEAACFYNPQWRDEMHGVSVRPVSYTYDAVVPGEKCPNCNGPMVAVRRAV